MTASRLTVLICTHNRADLLARVLQSLNQARRPPGWQVQLLVVPNACRDTTHALLDDYRARAVPEGLLPLQWQAEPTPGKSHALNRGAALLEDGWVAIVDDDHRVAADFLVEIAAAVAAHPQASMLCGRILPDWDGSEPAWVHDTGPYRIYPLPIPRQEFGAAARELGVEGPIPGGGNQILQVATLRRVGLFSTALGPQGHDLGGGEDTEYMLRALRLGERLVYEPRIVQHHYVDTQRLRLGYLMRKAYQRSRAGVQFSSQAGRGVPLYAWRKLAGYAAHTLTALSWSKARFYLVRTAAGLGEIDAMRGSAARQRALHPGNAPGAGVFALLAVLVTLFALGMAGSLDAAAAQLLIPAGVAAGASVLLLARSMASFSRTGPNLQEEVLRHYARYTALALLRLTFWAWLLLLLMAGLGALGYLGLALAWPFQPHAPGLALASLAGIVWVIGLQFSRHLRYLPASICASLNILPSRLYRLWHLVTPARLRLLLGLTLGGLGLVWLAASVRLWQQEQLWLLVALWGMLSAYAAAYAWATWQPSARPGAAPATRPAGARNILLIGSDTLRADRLGAWGQSRGLTPHLDALAARGTVFTHCYVPCARTAPSILSMLTGMWPHHHGVRDNFVAGADTELRLPDLPGLLRQHGYTTVAISDWCGADLKKFAFGYDHVDAPDDQWNIKYLIRQGPKGLRLMLSLFTHNRFGKTCLPELYYLAGVPMTTELGHHARHALCALAAQHQPFLLHLFYSTTHPPFGVEHPYYTRLAKPSYGGESKFVMSRLTEPFEIIRRQGQPREEFDLEQILDLYDSCVMRFDDEVGGLMQQLAQCGLADDTLVVVYSDHGMEFFEHNTWGQGNSAVGDFSPRVPLIIADPDLPPARCDTVVRSIDLMPTLLQRVGIAPPRRLDGRSLMPALRGEALEEAPAFNETGIWIADIPGLPADHLRYPNLLELLEVPDRQAGTLAIKPHYRDITVLAKDRMIRTGHWKLVYQPLLHGCRLRLFDTRADPNCEHDLSQRHPEVTARLWALLRAWMAEDRLMAQALDKNGTTDCPACR